MATLAGTGCGNGAEGAGVGCGLVVCNLTAQLNEFCWVATKLGISPKILMVAPL